MHLYSVTDFKRIFYFSAQIELISLIDKDNTTSIKVENAFTDLSLTNSLFINGLALNLQGDTVKDIANCEEMKLGIMIKYRKL